MSDRITAPKVRAMKSQGRRIVSLTAYDYTSGLIADAAGVDFVLVGDSLGNVILGFDTTIPVSLDHILHHVRATRPGVSRALLVADMPFGSYQSSPAQAVDSAVALMKAGAEAVKLEGSFTDAIAAITRAGIPAMGHVGMTPQSVNAFGGFRVQGKGEDADQILKQAQEIEAAGAFAVVLELVPDSLSKRITECLDIPTIGIGAGADCDGQIQVFHDVVGLNTLHFRHAKRYAAGRSSFLRGIRKYAKDVREGRFPTSEHSF